ncbi:hypothetical protein [Desulfotomaculum copahuensis]|uniref:Uncharacterized protein n=1 Tax=Desulfotomaculum copahuensis TaxID=1838280 RepID=A0A1B7LHQ3_9FIRM|nr:hypothetical protein [Desulfotomaculum copahuensis]OAT85836.1 hypothetical protein A6M21_04980 [Desulfotomaculum copahuensis]
MKNKKRLLWPVMILLLLMAALVAGCGNSTTSGTATPAGNSGQAAGNSTTQSTWNASTAKLFGTLRRVEGLTGDKKYPLTSEQAKKILPIVKDIAAQKTIAADYASGKQKEIIAVLSPEQQKVISTIPHRPPNVKKGATNRPANSGNSNNRGEAQNAFLERMISALQQKADS